MIHTPRNAGCYDMREILKQHKRQKLKEEIGGLCMFISLMLLCYLLTACGTWEVKFGMSEYNGSTENRTYDANRKK